MKPLIFSLMVLAAFSSSAVAESKFAKKMKEPRYIEYPYFPLNAGEILLSDDGVTVHKRENTYEFDAGKYTPRINPVCFPLKFENGAYSDMLDVVLVLDMPVDLRITGDWLGTELAPYIEAKLIPELCPDAAGAIVDIQVKGWGVTERGDMYETEDVAHIARQKIIGFDYYPLSVEIAHVSPDIGVSYAAKPLARVFFVSEERVLGEESKEHFSEWQKIFDFDRPAVGADGQPLPFTKFSLGSGDPDGSFIDHVTVLAENWKEYEENKDRRPPKTLIMRLFDRLSEGHALTPEVVATVAQQAADDGLRVIGDRPQFCTIGTSCFEAHMRDAAVLTMMPW